MQVAISMQSCHHYHKLNCRISTSVFAIVEAKRSMVTTAASSSSGGSSSSSGTYTTIKERERVRFEREIKKSKFIAIVGSISDEQSAFAFLSQVGDQYRSNDDGEPSGTAGKPILSSIVSSGIDKSHGGCHQDLLKCTLYMNFGYFGGIKLGTGGLVRAFGGVASECLRNAPTSVVKTKVPMGIEVPFDLLGILYHQLQSFQVEDIEQDNETGKDNITMVTFKVDLDCAEKLEDAIKANSGRDLVFYKR